MARLTEAARAAIAHEIASGGDPGEVVAAHLPEAAPAEVNPDREYEVFLAAGTHAVESLDGREDRVCGGMDLNSEIKSLKRVISLIERLIDRHRKLKKLRAQTSRSFGMPRT